MKLSFRYAIAAIVMAGALFLLSPTLMPEDVNLPGASRISLGLDLKGGVQLTLGVDTEKAVQSSLINSGQVLRQKAREAGITVLGPRQMPGGVQELIIARANQVDAFLALAKKDAPQVVPGTPRTGADGAVHLPYSFTPAFVKQTQDLAVDQVLRTISSRIDQFGVAEPDIRKQQGDRILIQLPGLTNVNRAVQLVEKSADLSFHLVRDDISQGYLPPGVAFYPMTGKHGEATNAKLALDSTPLLSGKEVADARPGFDNKNTSMVSLSFTPRGAALFEMATGEHVGKRLAIVLDGTIHSAPVIQEKIAGGTASISGQFTPEEAQDLAISLRSGSLAAPVHVLEQRTVGPALGEASITSGILAALIGTLAVMIIMPLRYGRSEVTVVATDEGGLAGRDTFAVMCRDDSREVDLYPNPVRDRLSIRMGRDVEGALRVTLYDAAGRRAFAAEVRIAPTVPAVVDLSSLGGGTYTIELRYEGGLLTRSIVKL